MIIDRIRQLGENLDLERYALREESSRFEVAEDYRQAAVAWTNFLNSFKRAHDLKLEIAEWTSKPSYHRLKNKFARDKIVKYLICSRNVLDHPNDQKIERARARSADPPKVELARGSFTLRPGAKDAFHNCVFSNDDGTFAIINTEIDWSNSHEPEATEMNVYTNMGDAVHLRQGSFKLLPASTQQGTVIEVPFLSEETSREAGIRFMSYAIQALGWETEQFY